MHLQRSKVRRCAREFLTLAQARKVLAKNPQWRARLNGDLQMHTEWSDGGGTISEMAAAAIERGYKFIASSRDARSPSSINSSARKASTSRFYAPQK